MLYVRWIFIVITKQEFDHLPDIMNGDVLLLENANGRLTCPQETAYMFAIATLEQKQYAGHDQYDYSGLDLSIVKKPAIPDVATQYAAHSKEIINNLTIPDPAKIGLQNRINSLLIAMNNAPSLDDALQLALQLPIDIEGSAG